MAGECISIKEISKSTSCSHLITLNDDVASLPGDLQVPSKSEDVSVSQVDVAATRITIDHDSGEMDVDSPSISVPLQGPIVQNTSSGFTYNNPVFNKIQDYVNLWPTQKSSQVSDYVVDIDDPSSGKTWDEIQDDLRDEDECVYCCFTCCCACCVKRLKHKGATKVIQTLYSYVCFSFYLQFRPV
jgi:hypothetical protein